MHVDIKLVNFTNKPYFAVQIVSFLMNIPKAANVKKKDTCGNNTKVPAV